MLFDRDGHRSRSLAGRSDEGAAARGLREMQAQNPQRIGGGDRGAEAFLEQRSQPKDSLAACGPSR
jgi:hypothetical protein